MTPWKIAVLDRATLVSEPFAFNFPAEVAEYPSTRPEETAARMAGADIVVTNKVVITAEHIAANPQLRLIAVAATGVNNVDTEAAKAAGVTVCNIRAYGNESVAEHSFMLMIALMRNLPTSATSPPAYGSNHRFSAISARRCAICTAKRWPYSGAAISAERWQAMRAPSA